MNDWEEHIRAATEAMEKANYETAEKRLDAAMEEARDRFSHTDVRIPQTLCFMAQLYFKQNELDKAEKALKKAVKLNDALQEPDETCQAMNLYTLASIEARTNRHNEAKRHFDEAFPLLQRTSTPQEIERLNADFRKLLNVSGAKTKAQKPQEKPAGKRSEQPKPTLGQQPAAAQNAATEDPQRLERFNSWTEDICEGLQLIESENMTVRMAGYASICEALQLAIEIFPEGHQNTGQTLNALALAAHYLDQVDQAEQLYLQALAVLEAYTGKDSLPVAQVKLNLATLYKESDRYGPADLYFRQSFYIIEKAPDLDEEWFNATASAFNLMLMKAQTEARAHQYIEKAIAAENAANLQEAANQLHEAYKLLRNHVDDSSEWYARVFSQQARILRKQGRATEAEQLQSGADKIARQNMEKQAMINHIASQLPQLPSIPWMTEVMNKEVSNRV
jgi:tetratricopeptide (TPR) repeat protein